MTNTGAAAESWCRDPRGVGHRAVHRCEPRGPSLGNIEFYHYDPYAQLFSKLLRGFRKDLLDAGRFLTIGMVEPGRFRELVDAGPASAYTRYPSLNRAAGGEAIDEALSGVDG